MHASSLNLLVSEAIQASIIIKQRLLSEEEVLFTIGSATDALIHSFQQGNKALLFGNGGSAADAQHIAAEFVGRFAFDRPALPALALSANSSCVTAIGNDYGYETVFARQIEALGAPGDVAIGISTSGKSANVLRGLAAARNKGLYTIALTGCTGASLRAAVDYCICVPSNETPRIQECHIMIGHIISQLVEEALFDAQSRVLRSRRRN